MTEKDRFPFPDQVEDRFHGNDRYRAGRMNPTPTVDRRDACPTDKMGLINQTPIQETGETPVLRDTIHEIRDTNLVCSFSFSFLSYFGD